MTSEFQIPPTELAPGMDAWRQIVQSPTNHDWYYHRDPDEPPVIWQCRNCGVEKALPDGSVCEEAKVPA